MQGTPKTKEARPLVINGGKRGWFIQWPNGFESAMPNQDHARRCAVADVLLAMCETLVSAYGDSNHPDRDAPIIKNARVQIAKAKGIS